MRVTMGPVETSPNVAESTALLTKVRATEMATSVIVMSTPRASAPDSRRSSIATTATGTARIIQPMTAATTDRPYTAAPPPSWTGTRMIDATANEAAALHHVKKRPLLAALQ